MRSFHPCLLALGMLAAAGCAHTVAELPQAGIAAQAIAIRDDSKQVTNVYGMTVYFGHLDRSNYYLTAQCDDHVAGGFGACYLIFEQNRLMTYGWAHWMEATDSDGKRFDIESLRREVARSGFTVRDVLGINLDKAYLTSHLETGIRIRVEGQNGEQELFVEPKYIGAFLDRVAAISSRRLSPNT